MRSFLNKRASMQHYIKVSLQAYKEGREAEGAANGLHPPWSIGIEG